MGINRYDMECNDYNDYSMNIQPSGDYVEYCDYEELEKKYESLVRMVVEIYREV